MDDFNLLGNITSVNQSLLSDQIETSLASWFAWAYLNIGNFQNINLSSSGALPLPNGQSAYPSQLRCVTEDPYYSPGQVWEAYRQDWVWETGVNFNGVSPIKISGVYVNGTFYPNSTTGTYQFQVNYPLGRVVFNSPISTSSVVQCEYTHRLYGWATSEAPWWKEIQENSFKIDDFSFLQQGSGEWSILGENRFQLPQAVVQSVPKTQTKGFQIGSYAKTIHQDVYIHCLAETPWDRKFLHDSIILQFQKRVVGFDKNKVAESGAFPLDDGILQSGALNFPDLSANFPWQQMRLIDCRSQDLRDKPPIYFSTVRVVVEVDVP